MPTQRRSASIALTFDDGPDSLWTPLVLDVLAWVGAWAAFFVNALLARSRPHLISRMRDPGVAIDRFLSLKVRPSPRLEGRARRGLSYDLAQIAINPREEGA